LGDSNSHGSNWVHDYRCHFKVVAAETESASDFYEHINQYDQIGRFLMVLNTRIITHPMNWVIVILMLMIAGIFGHLLLSLFDQEPTTAGKPISAGMASLSAS
jgi:hypothetical protein